MRKIEEERVRLDKLREEQKNELIKLNSNINNDFGSSLDFDDSKIFINFYNSINGN